MTCAQDGHQVGPALSGALEQAPPKRLFMSALVILPLLLLPFYLIGFAVLGLVGYLGECVVLPAVEYVRSHIRHRR